MEQLDWQELSLPSLGSMTLGRNQNEREMEREVERGEGREGGKIDNDVGE